MVNTSHSQKGLTLIEVIVVALILAILSAVAVPIYLKYVQNSKVSQANNIAGAVASFCGACGAEVGVCAIGQIPTLTMAGEATCSTNGSTITLPQGFDITITGISGTGTVEATDIMNNGLNSLAYEF